MPNKPPDKGPPQDKKVLVEILQRLVRIETRQARHMKAQGLNIDGSECKAKEKASA